jgi:hypothetical protein
VRLHVDDDIYRVDGVWLGPPQKTLPWRARYLAYGVGLLVFLLLQVIERRVGLGVTFWSLAYSLLVTIALTRLALSVVDHDRTVWSVITAFAHEVGAPRLGVKPRTTTWRPRRVRRRARLMTQRPWQRGKA